MTDIKNKELYDLYNLVIANDKSIPLVFIINTLNKKYGISSSGFENIFKFYTSETYEEKILDFDIKYLYGAIHLNKDILTINYKITNTTISSKVNLKYDMSKLSFYEFLDKIKDVIYKTKKDYNLYEKYKYKK